jgi:hypothetical protein
LWLWAALAAASACSKPPPPPPKLASSDVAVDRYLGVQPATYGAIAQWAHQFMLVEEAVSRLEAQGFQCAAAAPGATTRMCEKRDTGWWERMRGKIRSERVVITLRHPGPRIAKIEGMRYEDTSKGPVYTANLAAPGLSFRNARDFADFVLDAHREWHPRKYCFPAAKQSGCDVELQARTATGWRHWDGTTPATAGDALESVEGLRAVGFKCENKDEAVKINRMDRLHQEDNYAWIECTGEALDGQAQRVRIGLDLAGQFALLRLSAGEHGIDVPVVPTKFAVAR